MPHVKQSRSWLSGTSGRGSARAEDAQGTHTQSHVSPSTLVYEDIVHLVVERAGGALDLKPETSAVERSSPPLTVDFVLHLSAEHVDVRKRSKKWQMTCLGGKQEILGREARNCK